jgi:2-keto-3-deoxy-L-fuconate dehydrogenase
MAPNGTSTPGTFAGKRVVVTQAGDFMGPAIAEAFAEDGETVIADKRELLEAEAADALIAEAGHTDVMIANLMLRNPRTSIL